MNFCRGMTSFYLQLWLQRQQHGRRRRRNAKVNRIYDLLFELKISAMQSLLQCCALNTPPYHYYVYNTHTVNEVGTTICILHLVLSILFLLSSDAYLWPFTCQFAKRSGLSISSHDTNDELNQTIHAHTHIVRHTFDIAQPKTPSYWDI